MLKQFDLFNLKLNHVRIFLESAECSSFSAAAERLHVTQPMVTKTIQTIQQELGLILFIRDHGKMRLTPAGRELYIQWKNIIQYFERSIEESCSIQEGRKNRLLIGIGSLATEEEMLQFHEAAQR